ncbi:3755_t:CDS:2, partial [Gigaspora rosea]
MQLKLCFKIEYDKDGFQTIETWQSVTHVANLTIVFGLQLKCIKQTRDYCYRSNVLRPLETLSNTAKRNRIKQIINDQDWITDYSKDELSEKIKIQAYVRAMNYNYISQDAFQSIAKIFSELDYEYMINNSTILKTNNDEIHINDEEVIHENWIPDKLHILLSITNCLWSLVLAKFDINNNKVKNIVCDKKLKMLCEFDLTKLFNKQRAILIQQLWDKFYQLYRLLHNIETIKVIFENKAKEW